MPGVWCTTTMYWKPARRGLGKDEGVAGCERELPLPSVREKNKRPGEAIPEHGARWDWCASVLPREEPDTACIQRGDKHHFRGDRFDLPCIPLGGRLPSDRSGLRRTGGERHNPADNNGKARQMRPGQLIAENFRLFRLRASRPGNGPALAVLFATRFHASQSKQEKQIYQSVRFE